MHFCAKTKQSHYSSNEPRICCKCWYIEHSLLRLCPENGKTLINFDKIVTKNVYTIWSKKLKQRLKKLILAVKVNEKVNIFIVKFLI